MLLTRVGEVYVAHSNAAAPARRQAGQRDDLGDDAREVSLGLHAQKLIGNRRIIHTG